VDKKSSPPSSCLCAGCSTRMRPGALGGSSQPPSLYTFAIIHGHRDTGNESQSHRGGNSGGVSVQGLSQGRQERSGAFADEGLHDGPQAVAVAPGVWTQRIPGVNLMESASHGAFIGYCAAVEKAIEKLSNDSGYTCW
jgi:hypothetical protein